MDRTPAIRPAEHDDALGIAEVHVESWRATYQGLVPQPLLDAMSVDRRADAWRQWIASTEGQTLIATDDARGEVIGFINVGHSRDDDAQPDVGELRAIYLRPAWWGAGIGRQLHDAGLKLLWREFSAATLWVLDTNARARAFYERHGWLADGATKEEDRGDAVLSEVRYRIALT